jgi:hypothetical protein
VCILTFRIQKQLLMHATHHIYHLFVHNAGRRVLLASQGLWVATRCSCSFSHHKTLILTSWPSLNQCWRQVINFFFAFSGRSKLGTFDHSWEELREDLPPQKSSSLPQFNKTKLFTLHGFPHVKQTSLSFRKGTWSNLETTSETAMIHFSNIYV